MSNYSALILSEAGLVGYWRLNELTGTTAADSGPNGLTGTYVASPILGVQSPTWDYGVKFDGSSQYVTIAHNAALNLVDGPLSIEAWVSRGATGAQRSICSKAGPAYQLVLDTNAAVGGQNPSAGYFIETTAALGLPGWHHLIVTKTGGTSTIYRDGALASVTNPAPSTLADNVKALLIGGDADAGQFFNGSICDVAVYSVVLTAAQALQHRNVGNNPAYARRLAGLTGNYGPLALRARYMARPQTVAAIAVGSSQEVIVG